MMHRAPLEQLLVAQNPKQSLDSQLNHISSGQLRRIERFRSKLSRCGCHNVRRMQRVLVFTVLVSCLCVSLVSASQNEANKTSTHSSTLSKHQRHRWHPHHRTHHHKSHHYYHTSVNRDLQYHIPATSIPRPSSVPLSPFYLLMQQLIRQQQSTGGRQRHPYYEHRASAYRIAQDSQIDETELNPNHNHTIVSRPWSIRQAGARLLLAIDPQMSPKIIYPLNRINSDDELPVCQAWQVCNKVDTYSSPWIEKQCRCGEPSASCSQSLSVTDGHTIVEKTKQYKLCEAVKKLPTCRYFRDITWTITTMSAKNEHDLNSLLTTVSSPQSHSVPAHHPQMSENITRQEVKCVCPANSVAYILKHQVYKTSDGQMGYRYHFACSPETKMRCKKKEPCRLFTARKRPKVEEVTTNTLCQCHTGTACPANHRHPSVLIGALYSLDNIRTFSAYCYPDGSAGKQQDELETKEDFDQDQMSSTESALHGNRIAKSATQDNSKQHYFY